MPILTASASSGGRSGSRVHKIKDSRRHSTAQTPSSASGAATTDHHWPALFNEASASSGHDEGLNIGRIPPRPSSDENYRLACPYAKLDSFLTIQTTRENGRIDRPRCWSKSYSNISRLKQHLYRSHCRPEFKCRRCQHDFSTEENLDAHCSQVPTCDPEEAECTGRMTESQEKRIKKKMRNVTPEASWFAMWRILFTDQRPPTSPYLEDQIPLNNCDHALANDLERLSGIIKDRLCGALLLTQFQQAILGRTVKQAVAEYSGNILSHIAQTQALSPSSHVDGVSSNVLNRNLPTMANNVPGQREEQVWSSSMLPSYFPRSVVIPGTTYPFPSWELDLSLGPPQAMQPDPNFLGQQDLVDHGDLFFGLSLDSDMSSIDNTQYDDWQAAGMSITRPT